MNQQTKNALVTGASKGVGRGIAIGLAEEGWNVGVNYFADQPGAEATADSVRQLGRQAWLLQADVGFSDQVRAMFEEFIRQAGQIHLLVNNAGVQTWESLLELKEEDWDRTIRTNLKGTYLCTQQAARLMKKTGGRIVNIGSGANKAPFPKLSDYCASKGGIETLTTVAAVELGRYGITVNCVAPGTIEIERTKLEDPDYAGEWGSRTPMGRIGHVQDVADAVAFFAGENSGFITGETLYVDGGLWAQVPWIYD
ncbi:MAG: SDR family NAD(P)-dependent oxidoreductase [Anaerolineales bacterium]|nr:SDR family NAD(P)-dependent oxidoreductase [Anaerolineales bacterium]